MQAEGSGAQGSASSEESVLFASELQVVKRGRKEARFFVLSESRLEYWPSQEECDRDAEPSGFIMMDHVLNVLRSRDSVVVVFWGPSRSGRILSLQRSHGSVVAVCCGERQLAIALLSEDDRLLDKWADQISRAQSTWQASHETVKVAEGNIAVHVRAAEPGGELLARNMLAKPSETVATLIQRLSDGLVEDRASQIIGFSLESGGAALPPALSLEEAGVRHGAELQAIMSGSPSHITGERLLGSTSSKATRVSSEDERGESVVSSELKAQGGGASAAPPPKVVLVPPSSAAPPEVGQKDQEEDDDEELDILCEGRLAVMGNSSDRMAYFFILTDEALAYWKTQADMDEGKDPEGFVVMEQVVAFVASDGGFSLHVRHDFRTRLLEFRAFEDRELDAWTVAFRGLLGERLASRFRDWRTVTTAAQGGTDFFEDLRLARRTSAPSSQSPRWQGAAEATWVQVEKVLGLPRPQEVARGTDTYILQASWLGDSDVVRTAERVGHLAAGPRSAEECDIRQQMILANAPNRFVIDLTLLRKRLRPGSIEEEETLGSCRLLTNDDTSFDLPRTYALTSTPEAGPGARLFVRLRLRSGAIRLVEEEPRPSADELFNDGVTENLVECKVPEGLPQDQLGLRFAGAPGRIFVEEVAAGSFGETCGIQAGDELLFVGQALACELPARRLDEALAARPAKLTLLRSPKPWAPRRAEDGAEDEAEQDEEPEETERKRAVRALMPEPGASAAAVEDRGAGLAAGRAEEDEFESWKHRSYASVTFEVPSIDPSSLRRGEAAEATEKGNEEKDPTKDLGAGKDGAPSAGAGAGAGGALAEDLRAAIAREVLVHAGVGVQPSDVAVRLRGRRASDDGGAGPLRVEARVAPGQPGTFTAASTYADLRASKSALGKALVKSMKGLPGLRAGLSGPLGVRLLKCTLVVEKRQDPHQDMFASSRHRERRLEHLRLRHMAAEDEAMLKGKAPRSAAPVYLQEISERLHGEHAERLYRKLRRQQVRVEATERAASATPAAASATSFLSRSPSGSICSSAAPARSLGSDAGAVGAEAGSRLHALHARKLASRRQRVAAKEAEEMVGADLVTANARARGARAGNHEALHADARSRHARQQLLEQHRKLQCAEAESLALGIKVPGADGEGEGTATGTKRPKRSANIDHAKQLHEDHERRRNRLEKVTAQREIIETKRLEQAAAEAKDYALPSELRSVSPKVSCWGRQGQAPCERCSTPPPKPCCVPTIAVSPPCCAQAQQPEPEPIPRQRRIGFGSSLPRPAAEEGGAGGDPSRFRVAAIDHIIISLNAAVSLRAGCEPQDAQRSALQALYDPLGEAFEAFRVAAEESERNTGGVAIKARPSRFLFSGHLTDESDGRVMCTEPDPVRQISEDVDTLMSTAQVAQTMLLLRLLPPDESISSTASFWPEGSCKERLRIKQAAFAVNPGVKSKDAINAKALVRFGPSRRRQRFQHVLDMARATLVFDSAADLQAGLDSVLDLFEVVTVRNHYQPSMQSFLGERFVEVLVVIDDSEAPEIHVCELRLEERCFFEAREATEHCLERIGKTFRHIYAQLHMNLQAVEYLARWSLRKPKESHAVTVFSRSMAKAYGSTFVAYRRHLGLGTAHGAAALASGATSVGVAAAPGGPCLAHFQGFRRICHTLRCRERSVEYWQGLDASLCGSVSLFELDPDALVLLAKFWARIVYSMAQDQKIEREEAARKSAQDVIHWMWLRSHQHRQARTDCVERPVLKNVVRSLGFLDSEADRLFALLLFDSSRKEGRRQLSEALSIEDIEWLKKLPRHVDLDAVMLTERSTTNAADSVFVLTWSGRSAAAQRRTLTPASLRPLVPGRDQPASAASSRAASRGGASGSGVGRRGSSGSSSAGGSRRKAKVKRRSRAAPLGAPQAHDDIILAFDPDLFGAAEYRGLDDCLRNRNLGQFAPQDHLDASTACPHYNLREAPGVEARRRRRSSSSSGAVGSKATSSKGSGKGRRAAKAKAAPPPRLRDNAPERLPAPPAPRRWPPPGNLEDEGLAEAFCDALASDQAFLRQDDAEEADRPRSPEFGRRTWRQQQQQLHHEEDEWQRLHLRGGLAPPPATAPAEGELEGYEDMGRSPTFENGLTIDTTSAADCPSLASDLGAGVGTLGSEVDFDFDAEQESLTY